MQPTLGQCRVRRPCGAGEGDSLLRPPSGRQRTSPFVSPSYSLTGADAGNYALTQPTGITASILPYALTGGEYAVNSNDWINHDFVVTAAEGYLLSLTDTADGVWQQTLRAADETAEGRLTFYVKDLATGAISLQVTEQYRIDRTQPTGEIRVDERTAWQLLPVQDHLRPLLSGGGARWSSPLPTRPAAWRPRSIC